MPTIFDPFVRGSTTAHGLGIGLAIVRRIADVHGGRVTAESEGPGRGSIFTLWLPRSSDAGLPAS
ncbi:MAG: sensor histidine kinase [Vicinamibacterales bacterium]